MDILFKQFCNFTFSFFMTVFISINASSALTADPQPLPWPFHCINEKYFGFWEGTVSEVSEEVSFDRTFKTSVLVSLTQLNKQAFVVSRFNLYIKQNEKELKNEKEFTYDLRYSTYNESKKLKLKDITLSNNSKRIAYYGIDSHTQENQCTDEMKTHNTTNSIKLQFESDSYLSINKNDTFHFYIDKQPKTF